jgi:hypothetical protein
MNIEFTQQQLQILNTAIIELPYRVAAPFIDHINHQVKRQQDLEVDKRGELSRQPSIN